MSNLFKTYQISNIYIFIILFDNRMNYINCFFFFLLSLLVFSGCEKTEEVIVLDVKPISEPVPEPVEEEAALPEEVVDKFVSCDKMADPFYRDLCYISIVKELKEVEICERIDGQIHLDNCYKLLGVDLVEPELCGRIEGQLQRNNCYSEVAKLAGDKTLCDNINGTYYKNKCYNGFT